MTDQQASTRPDVSEMKAVHRVFRDTLDAAPALVGGVSPSDVERRTLVSNFYENVLLFLHVHHQTEEDLVFPLLRQRSPAQLATVEHAAGQHAEVLELLSAAESSLGSWAAGDAQAQPSCADDLAKLGASLGRHLDDEEAELLPLCAEHLSIEEWSAQPGHAMAHFQGDKVWLILCLVRQRMTQEQRDEMLDKVPPPVRQMLSDVADSFDQLMADIGAPLG